MTTPGSQGGRRAADGGAGPAYPDQGGPPEDGWPHASHSHGEPGGDRSPPDPSPSSGSDETTFSYEDPYGYDRRPDADEQGGQAAGGYDTELTQPWQDPAREQPGYGHYSPYEDPHQADPRHGQVSHDETQWADPRPGDYPYGQGGREGYRPDELPYEDYRRAQRARDYGYDETQSYGQPGTDSGPGRGGYGDQSGYGDGSGYSSGYGERSGYAYPDAGRQAGPAPDYGNDATQSYARPAEYGGPAEHGQPAEHGGAAGYADRPRYADPYERSDPYESRDPHESRDPYEQRNDPYEQQSDPYDAYYRGGRSGQGYPDAQPPDAQPQAEPGPPPDERRGATGRRQRHRDRAADYYRDREDYPRADYGDGGDYVATHAVPAWDAPTDLLPAIQSGLWPPPAPEQRIDQRPPRTRHAGQAGTAPPAAEQAGPSIVRSSGVMAIGTLASRGTGLLRTLVQAYALGAAGLSIAYNNANTLPNVVYNLVIGGILTSVIVPLLVNAAKRDRDRGEAYDQRMFTLITFALLALTLIATLAAAPLVDLYKGSTISASTAHLMVIFAYFFIPQIFFYGVSSLASAILNARGSFAAPMWTPVINNVVVIVILLMFLGIAGPGTSQGHLSSGEIGLVGLGTTLGIIAQTVALIPAMRQVGFRWRPRTDFRRSEVREIGRMGGWMFGYIAATQIAFLVTTLVANTAGGKLEHTASRFANYTAYTYGWQLFQMPYAVVGISVITALLPRMSAHAADRRLSLVRDDFSAGVRLSSVIVVPCSLVLAVLGPQLGLVFLAHGHTSPAAGRYEGTVFALFCLGLLPYMFFQLQLRVFYALHDSRTPALIGVVTTITNIAVNLLALALLPSRDVVAGLGIGFGLANLAGTIVAWRVLSRRLGGLDGHAVTRSLVRMHVATIPAAVFALAVSVMLSVIIGTGHLAAFVIVLLASGGALFLYVLFAKALRIRELTDLTESVTSRFRR